MSQEADNEPTSHPIPLTERFYRKWRSDGEYLYDCAMLVHKDGLRLLYYRGSEIMPGTEDDIPSENPEVEAVIQDAKLRAKGFEDITGWSDKTPRHRSETPKKYNNYTPNPIVWS